MLYNHLMENIKLIAFDVDGTLVPLGGKKIEDLTAKAVRAFEEKGGKVIIATGRCSYFIHKEIVEEMNCDYYVTINGGLVCDKDFKTLYQRPMDEDFFHKLVKSGIEHDLAFAFKFEKAIAVYNKFDEYIKNYTVGKLYPKLVLDYSQTRDYHLEHGIPIDGFFIGDNEVLENNAKATPEITWVHAYDRAMECYSKDISKASGIEFVAKSLGLTMDNVMVFGDGENDIDMIKKAGLGVAMGNADEVVKKAAKYVTTACGDNGIYNAMKHFDLI